MTNLTDGERLVAVETKLDIVLETLKKLDEKTESFSTNLVPRTEYEEAIAKLETQIELAKKKTSMQTWVTGTLSAVLGIILTLIGLILKDYFNL